jgi:hypothetical protein
VRVDSSQRGSLRRQTLEVLDLEHHRFDDFAERTVAEQVSDAATAGERPSARRSITEG